MRSGIVRSGIVSGVAHPPLPAVRYGSAALSDLLPSVLAAQGVPGEPRVLDLPELSRVVVLLVDGMGWELLRRHPEVTPFLSSLTGRPLTAGFPTTTATSLASLGTGLTPGEHGLTGYTSWVPEVGETVSWLGWTPVGRGTDLRERLVPEELQPQPTVFERAAHAGIEVTQAAAVDFVGSGLTRAVLRGAHFPGTVTLGDALAQAVDGVRRGPRSLVYCYVGELDLVGHVRGPESAAWRAQLRLVDQFAELLAARLPDDATMLVTADHGMVRVGEDAKVDADAVPVLRDGVAALAGEPRARHVHAVPGAARDVLATWTDVLGERMWVGSGDEAVAAGLFGPVVTPTARARIGDVVAISRGEVAVVRRRVEERMSALVGHHGALTLDELLVPLLRT